MNQKNCENAVDFAKKELERIAPKRGAEKYGSGNLYSYITAIEKSAKELDVSTSNLESNWNAFKSKYDAWTEKTDDTAAATAAATATANLKAALESVGFDCKGANADVDENSNAKKTKTAAGITGALTAVGGGIMTFYATKAIKNAALDKAEQEAYDTFMNEIGNHIYCYIGGEEAGQYGDVITTSME